MSVTYQIGRQAIKNQARIAKSVTIVCIGSRMINTLDCVTSIDQSRNSPIANNAIGGKVAFEHVEISTK